ncbi:hypothetical protein F2Q70_00015719 [Brassica cretica]|uniref:Uncharacterized protein n=1 Tax=Brassica cretica TaxID=69181 RepID=A0A8S9HZ09_BRACR|nr:hypothetical protein F2Q70_00015719 [Brassica cretica]
MISRNVTKCLNLPSLFLHMTGMQSSLVAHNDDNSDSLPDGQTFEIGAGAEILRFWNVFASLESEIKTTCAGSVDSAALRTTSVFSSAPLDIPTVHP